MPVGAESLGGFGDRKSFPGPEQLKHLPSEGREVFGNASSSDRWRGLRKATPQASDLRFQRPKEEEYPRLPRARHSPLNSSMAAIRVSISLVGWRAVGTRISILRSYLQFHPKSSNYLQFHPFSQKAEIGCREALFSGSVLPIGHWQPPSQTMASFKPGWRSPRDSLKSSSLHGLHHLMKPESDHLSDPDSRNFLALHPIQNSSSVHFVATSNFFLGQKRFLWIGWRLQFHQNQTRQFNSNCPYLRPDTSSASNCRERIRRTLSSKLPP